MTQFSFDAVIFDLDGVITKTALVHSAAWTKMFNEFLKENATTNNIQYKPFTHEGDYLPFVDGKPRYKGVESFLLSRNIELPFGDPSDLPSQKTICGLGNRKNQAFNEVLEKDGVEIYPSTVELIHNLKAAGIHVGVASSSKNCRNVLETAGLIDLFEVRIDGEVSAEIGLEGKPEPDIFTTAADRMGVEYFRSVVVEDAVSGVAAGKKGNFGFVLGVAREDNKRELLISGADIAVSDLEEINGLEGIEHWFQNGLIDDMWSVSYNSFDSKKEKSHESLFTIGNGYFGTRGANDECIASDEHYPGTYIAGLYNRLVSKVGDRDIENEDFVNCPNWIPFTFKIDNGDWFNFDNCKIIDYNKNIDFRDGFLEREITVEDKNGKQTRIYSCRIADMSTQHIAAQRYGIEALNWEGEATIRAGIDGDIINDGVARYRELNQKHTSPIVETSSKGMLSVTVETTQSKVRICEAAKVTFGLNGSEIVGDFISETEKGKAFSAKKIQLKSGDYFESEKIVAIFTDRDENVENIEKATFTATLEAGDFNEIYQKSSASWSELWQQMDIEISGDRLGQKLLRMHHFHTMISASHHNKNLDASITARGLHGEAYRGHVFWDELFILPFYNTRFPEISKALLMYRYNRLDEARKSAKNYGYKGAMYPWQSGSSGREETQTVHLNPMSGEWGPDFSSLQRHVSLAIAYNVWSYVHSSNDWDFFADYGAEIMLEICRFWASKMKLNNETGRYSIKNVMGPDEFHESYPNSEEGGITDNAYTNLMVAWLFDTCLNMVDEMGDDAIVLRKLTLSKNDLEELRKKALKLNIIINEDGIIAQYDGYFDLKELDWDSYKEKYGNVYRMDRLLKSEGKSADDYKVAKQADTLQIFYNLDEATVTKILTQLGYKLPTDYLQKNLHYYLARTSHGSTLSRVVHARLANMVDDRKLSWQLYRQALESDYIDIQGGTTAEGVHSGVMAATAWNAVTAYCGLDLRGEILRLSPKLPKLWKEMKFSFVFKETTFFIELNYNNLRIKASKQYRTKSELTINNEYHLIKNDNWHSFSL